MPLDNCLLSTPAQLGVRKTTSIQTFDLFTMYTSNSDDLIKSLINNIINKVFRQKHPMITG